MAIGAGESGNLSEQMLNKYLLNKQKNKNKIKTVQVLPVTRGIEKPARADWGVLRKPDLGGWPHWRAADFSGIQDPPWPGPTPRCALPWPPKGRWRPPDLRPGARRRVKRRRSGLAGRGGGVLPGLLPRTRRAKSLRGASRARVVRATKGPDQWKAGAAEGPPLCAAVSGLFAPPSPRPH